ncbi:mycothiol synthase [Corynebacterium flavescens]
MISNGHSIEHVQLPGNPQRAQLVATLAKEAENQDKIAPFSEEFLKGLKDARLGHQHFLVEDGSTVVGCGAIHGDSAEMFIAPQYRGKGLGSALYAALVAANPAVQVWAHGNLAPAQAIAAAHGLKVVRRLLVMEVSGEALVAAAQAEDSPLPAANLRESTKKWGRQVVEEQWLEANNEAFSWHPEQGGWDLERLHRAMEAPWFDPEDVLFLWDEGPQLAGFHWTKWHTESSPAFGEVYVIGLADSYRGKKLGGPLLTLGLHHLVGKGAHKVILYVEADNAPAVKVYERLGFEIAEQHCVWARGD